MKILAFVDLHGSLTALKEIKKKAKKADIIVCAGDLTIFEADMEFLIDELSHLGKEIIMVHGNHEGADYMKEVCGFYDNIHFIHKKKKVIGDVLFLGYGGKGFSIEDEEFDKLAKKFEKWIKSSKAEKVVLVSHAPPYGTKLDKIGGEFVGNLSLKEFIVNMETHLLVCGHLHETAGKKDEIEGTLMINPGPKGKIVEV
ncbi:metallophosphoesterase family protein [Candidatus Woesearchaeota archaeon]|nr:metallophosphoesterase family protein [Candidatus Woesearchaeota archaeon]